MTDPLLRSRVVCLLFRLEFDRLEQFGDGLCGTIEFWVVDPRGSIELVGQSSLDPTGREQQQTLLAL